MTADELDVWAARVAAGFRVHEHRLPTDAHADRDSTLIAFTVRALADPTMPGTADIIEAIDRQRAHHATKVIA